MKPKALNLTLTALFTVIIALCSMLSFPTAIPLTLQTFGIFLSLFVLGGKYATVSIAVHFLLGAVGLPVFHGFNGGIGVIAGATGGYIVGFLVTGPIYILITKIGGNKTAVKFIAAFTGLIVCYIAGTVWFTLTWSDGKGFIYALITCVAPFIIPDTAKIILAYFIAKRLKKINPSIAE